jgi:hypothetical protein
MYTNKQQFRLPFNLEERDRQRLREIQLYVKCGTDGWACRETAPPSQKYFTFRAAQDGEYCFNIVTVDKAGHPTPADVTREAPALVVVVDTQPPELQLAPATGPGGEDCLRCSAHDPNMEAGMVKVEYQAADKSWHALDALPGSPELFRYPDKMNWTGQLRASATDRADNTATRELNGSAWVAAKPQQPLPQPAAPVVITTGPMEPAPAAVRNESHMDRPPMPAGPDLGVPQHAAAAAPLPPPTPASSPAPAPAAAPLPPSAPVQSQPVIITTGGRELNSSGHDASMANRQLINSMHVVLDYRIDQVGPSGVSKIDVWMTPDEGKTWQRVLEDREHRSPVEFDLPHEGLYGVCLVVTNGNSISDPPPAAGTTPDWWIEVDTTRPTAQLQSVRPGNGDDAGALVITWAASDKNLGSEPIDLYYAAHREGPWAPIGRGLRNDGSYRWTAPKDGASEYFIRMDVTDRAGNLTRCETPQAVVLDLVHPKAKVLGVSANGPRPMNPPQGN